MSFINTLLDAFIAGLVVGAAMVLISVFIGHFMGKRLSPAPAPEKVVKIKKKKGVRDTAGHGPFADHLRPIGANRLIPTVKDEGA